MIEHVYLSVTNFNKINVGVKYENDLRSIRRLISPKIWLVTSTDSEGVLAWFRRKFNSIWKQSIRLGNSFVRKYYSVFLGF